MKTNSHIPLVLVALGATWGSAFVLMKVLVDEISPTQIVAARLALGAAVLFVVLAATGRLSLPAPGLGVPVLLLCLVDNVIPNTLVAWSETRIDGGMASVLMSTMPLFTTVFAMTVLKESAGVIRVAGLAIGFFGIVMVSDGAVLDVSSSGGLGMLAVAGAACSHAAGAIYTKVLLTREDPLRLTAFKLSMGAVTTVPIVLATQGTGAYMGMSTEAVLCLGLLGVLATGAAYAAYIWVVGAVGAIQASLVTYIIPVAGLTLSWVALGEQISVSTIAGAAVIIVGVAIVMYGPRLRLPRMPLTENRHAAEQNATA